MNRKYRKIMFRLSGTCKQIFTGNIPNAIQPQRWLETKAWKAAHHFRKQDQIDDEYKLIYSPPKTELLLAANSIFTCTGLFSPVLLSSYCYTMFFTENTVQIAELATSIFSSFGSIFILYFIRSFPIRIYRNQEQYTAVLPGFMGAKRKFYFQKGDVVEQNVSIDNKLPFIDAKITEARWFMIRGKKLFLVTKYFERPRDLFDMFTNSRKYIMHLKKMEKDQEQKLFK